MPIQDMPTSVRDTIRPVETKPIGGAPPAPVKKRNRKPWIYALGAILLAAIAVLAYQWSSTPPPAAWGASEVRRGTVTKSISATGKLDALTTVNVGSQVSGTVSELYVDFNSPVKKGRLSPASTPHS